MTLKNGDKVIITEPDSKFYGCQGEIIGVSATGDLSHIRARIRFTVETEIVTEIKTGYFSSIQKIEEENDSTIPD